jgi:hypothetical protein
MKISTKKSLANFTIWLMIATISVIVLFFIGFIASTAFDLQVFTSRTTDSVLTLFSSSLVIIICAAFLNISLNVSIIAEVESQKLKSETEINQSLMRRLGIYAGSVVLLLLIGLFAGNYFSRQNQKQQLLIECNDILSQYSKAVTELSTVLTDSIKVKKVPEILKFLEEQKSEFPSVTLIVQDKYKGQATYLKITSFTNEKDLSKPLFNYSIYSCSHQDSNYLKEVFNHSEKSNFFWYDNNDYRLYIPILTGNRKYVLMFSKYQRGGKFGS